MKSPQAMLQFLRKRRQDAAEKLAPAWATPYGLIP